MDAMRDELHVSYNENIVKYIFYTKSYFQACLHTQCHSIIPSPTNTPHQLSFHLLVQLFGPLP
jgi:hypothetical protein